MWLGFYTKLNKYLSNQNKDQRKDEIKNIIYEMINNDNLIIIRVGFKPVLPERNKVGWGVKEKRDNNQNWSQWLLFSKTHGVVFDHHCSKNNHNLFDHYPVKILCLNDTLHIQSFWLLDL